MREWERGGVDFEEVVGIDDSVLGPGGAGEGVVQHLASDAHSGSGIGQ